MFEYWNIGRMAGSSGPTPLYRSNIYYPSISNIPLFRGLQQPEIRMATIWLSNYQMVYERGCYRLARRFKIISSRIWMPSL
jgi:hypothetical protein